MKGVLEAKPCSCGGQLIPALDGWCCDKCDGRLKPYSKADMNKAKWLLEGICVVCEGKGHWPCEECDGDGYVECNHCGHEHECSECWGRGMEICRNCNGESEHTDRVNHNA